MSLSTGWISRDTPDSAIEALAGYELLLYQFYHAPHRTVVLKCTGSAKLDDSGPDEMWMILHSCTRLHMPTVCILDSPVLDPIGDDTLILRDEKNNLEINFDVGKILTPEQATSWLAPPPQKYYNAE
jgi:hypothetical protein